MVFLDQKGIARYEDLERKIAELQDANSQAVSALKDVERRLSDMALLIKNIATYKELKPLYDEYKQSRDKAVYQKNALPRRGGRVAGVARQALEAETGKKIKKRNQKERKFGLIFPGYSL